MEKSPFKASASQKGSHEAVTEAQTVLVSEVGDISLLTQVNRAAEAVEAYKKRKAEYEEYLESIRKTYTYAAPDITEEEIVTMLESDEEPQIMSTDVMEIVEENEETVPEEHVNDEVVEEEGTELTETASLSYGIDVSHYQYDIDWAKVKASGVDFAIIKCGGRSVGDDAALYEDPYFEDNIMGALANGVQVGVYFFSQATTVTEAFEEASYCLDLISKYQITYPVAIDWESGDGFRVNEAGLDSDSLTQIIEVFCDTVEGCGYDPMVYFCRNDWYKVVNADELTEKYKTWLALYYNEYYYTDKTWEMGNSVAEFDYKYDCWQYGVSNTVDGIDGYVDMDLAFFAYSNYEIQGLQEPELNVALTEIEVKRGEDWNLLDGVYGVNSLGYIVDVVCEVDGEELTNTSGLAAGQYTVTYSMKDPRRGTVTQTATLNVTESARIVVSKTKASITEGDSYNFLKGVTAYDSDGNTVTPTYVITNSKGKVVTSVVAAGEYTITYNYTDKKQGNVSATVSLTVNEKTTYDDDNDYTSSAATESTTQSTTKSTTQSTTESTTESTTQSTTQSATVGTAGTTSGTAGTTAETNSTSETGKKDIDS
jgi:GH25 family lysozyme M1 (1,4-beta-N-acetylmuramidase)